MAVEILRPAPESAGARRASAIERAELVSPAKSTKVPDPEVNKREISMAGYYGLFDALYSQG